MVPSPPGLRVSRDLPCSTAPETYLSAVVVARNDDHGGAFLERMQLFVADLLESCGRYGLPLELIVVEWNPDPARAGLRTALEWPVTPPAQVRIVTVPLESHRRLAHADRIPLFQMIGKNVGIRRARGEFVLATNVDLLFSRELIEWLAARKLESGTLYRIDRTDVPARIVGSTLDDRLDFCAENVLRVHRRDGTYAPDQSPGPMRRLGAALEHWRALVGRRASYNDAFANAAGDFTLLARADWLKLRGYPEIHRWSLYQDGLLCCAAIGSGLKVDVLAAPMRLYHMEHEQGFDTFAVKRTNPKLGLALSYDEYRSWALELLRGNGTPWRDSDDWGLASEELPETRILP
jgi:hypothetical protein